MITKNQLLYLLQAKRIFYKVYEHPPVFTANEAAIYCADIPGAHVKNLFLRNKKKTKYLLLTILDDKLADLTKLGETLELGRLSFASHQDLVAILGVQPGSVTPLAILNDNKIQVELYFDKALYAYEYVNVHPMENSATLHLKTSDLSAFIEAEYSRSIRWIDVPINKRS